MSKASKRLDKEILDLRKEIEANRLTIAADSSKLQVKHILHLNRFLLNKALLKREKRIGK